MSFSQGFGNSNPFSGGIFGSGPGGRGGSSGSGDGGDGPTERQETGGRSRRPSALIITIIIIAALLGAFIAFSGFYAEVMWYSHLGYSEVFWTEWMARGGIFAASFLVMGLLVWLSLFYAFRSRQQDLEGQVSDSVGRYQSTLTSMRRLLIWGLPVLMGLFAGTAAQANWETVLLFFNQEPFGQTDPEFGLDFAFYVFTMPFLNFLVGFLISAVLVAGIAGVLCHYLFGSIRIEQNGKFIVETGARWHVAVTAALFLLLQGVNWWLARYGTLQDQGGNWAGAMFTDINAVVPAQAILAISAALVAAVFIITAITARWRFSIIGTAMLIVAAIIGSGVVPFLVQEYRVSPTEQTLERDYIERNMELTRFAYGLDELEKQNYDAATTPEAGALEGDEANIENIRLLDPNLVSNAYRQFQQFRPYYTFPDTLSFDRYEIDGETVDTVVTAREVTTDSDSWVNQHLIYTHGYGLVAANANTVTPEGRPDFSLQGIPTTGELASDEDYEPRIYFGEFSPQYSIVGAPEGESPMELDRPATQMTEDEDGEGAEGEADEGEDTQYTFTGDGGPSVGNTFNRLIYALNFQSPEILLSGDMNEESQILYDRHPRERVEKVAPYLEVDQNVYPAIVGDRVKWIVEGYTTSSDFPYSTEQQLESATQDALTQGGPQLTGQVNYIRNSVKATVDAYDGSVELYAWDDEDPILQAWQTVFPSSLNSYEDMSAELLDHVRYPEDMFRVQRELLTEYHVDDPGTFYEGNDAWSVPDDPTTDDDIYQPPYYMTLQMPQQDESSFQLTSTFIPATTADGQQRNVLYGFLAASGDAGTGEDGVKAEDYGRLRLLELPRQTAIPGPGQTQANFDSHTTVAHQLNILDQAGSTVINGNMISIPAGGGILNVQPVYVQSAGTEAAYPALRMVLVAFGENVGYGDTLQEALDDLFGGDAGAEAAEGAGVDAEAVEDEVVEGGVEDPEAPPEEDEEEASPSPTPEETEEATTEDDEDEDTPTVEGDQEQLDQLRQEAADLWQQRNDAFGEGERSEYLQLEMELEEKLDELFTLEDQLNN
ncbi:UPF0182 family protein [Nesterenkonia sp. MY13]|uniref:UPF0182 protein HGQ17_04455 n=1 Tax=Nesterenkonia sedimenti TaxID=1463632 RepID=A0A7X8TJJ1_9MICC|nr:UPF0182 family protein [Nesterenkonia sedimenti]NLS09268.1 UPF0182 family protein [Nesterenkonia sedimenti]